MKKILLIVLASLAGCGHVVTLYPRGGGDQATGTLNDGSRNMTIILKGISYSGKFVRGQTFGFGMSQSVGSGFPKIGTSMMVGSSNQSSALLVSDDGKSVLRCELTVVAASGGNGVCVDKDSIVYDANLRVQ
jgi:hypothetical protein